MRYVLRSNSNNKDFVFLVKKLDAYLKITDGEDHNFYNQFNGIDNLKHVVIVYEDKQPIGCGAFKAFEDNSVEIKRMFTLDTYRNKGVASDVLIALEKWAKELGYKHTVLETGKRQKEAVAFYKKQGYCIAENYGQYIGMANSLCFNKRL